MVIILQDDALSIGIYHQQSICKSMSDWKDPFELQITEDITGPNV